MKAVNRPVRAVAFVLACITFGVASAQTSKPITLVVPFTAGSGTDVIARIISEPLSKELGQAVIVENRPGAGGTLGAAYAAAAAPDGNTMLVHSAAHVANAAIYPRLRYDTRTAFAPVTMLASLPNVLVVSRDSGVRTLEELVRKARENPGKLAYASAGNGSATHINAEKFRTSAKLQASHIPYRGTPPALVDVIGGQVDWAFAPVVSAQQLIEDGKLTALAVGSPQRAVSLPEVPTTLEKGFKGSDYTFWVGLFLPGKASPSITERIAAATTKILKDPAVKDALGRLGAEPGDLSQKQFSDQVESEIDSISALIKQAGIKPD